MIDSSFNNIHDTVSYPLPSRLKQMSTLRGPSQYYPGPSMQKINVPHLESPYKPQWNTRRWKFYDVFDTLWDDYEKSRRAEYQDFVPYYLAYYVPHNFGSDSIIAAVDPHKASADWRKIHDPAYDRAWWRPVRPNYTAPNQLDHALMMHRHRMIDYKTLDKLYFSTAEAEAKRQWAHVWPNVVCSN